MYTVRIYTSASLPPRDGHASFCSTVLSSFPFSFVSVESFWDLSLGDVAAEYKNPQKEKHRQTGGADCD